MPAKRKGVDRFNKGRGYVLQRNRTKKMKKLMKKVAKDTFMGNVETIKSVNSVTDGQEIAHNNYISLSDNLLYTSQGDKNPDNSAGANRTGDQITLRGLSLKFMVELNERYSDVTFRLMIIKCARGDIPSRASLFTGISGNKMLDTFNTDRYTIIRQKYFKLKAPNAGTIGGQLGGVNTGSGLVLHSDTLNEEVISRATKIVKMYIPGTAFTRSGVIQYENDSPNPKFFDYRCILYAYSNYSTNQDVWNVARLNDIVKVLYYKDA
jgi:hypothetical protein